MADKGKRVKDWLNDESKENKPSENNLLQCHFLHQKLYMY